MYGVIIGDIIGSKYEMKSSVEDIQLFTEDSRYTDDTILTVAVADMLLSLYPKNFTDKEIAKYFKYYYDRNKDRGYGSNFRAWAEDINDFSKPNSLGNGAVMRISPVANFCFKQGLSLEEALRMTHKITEVTHNHPESINAATALVETNFRLLSGENKIGVLEDIEKKYFIKIFKNDDDLKNNSSKTVKSYDTIQIALSAFYTSNSFDEAVIKCIKLGGDTDTYGAVVGSIAECIYDIPKDWIDKAKKYFNEDGKGLLKIVEVFEGEVKEKTNN